MNKIYVVVLVTYDYHRFQKNVFASESLAEAKIVAMVTKSKYTDIKAIYEYEEDKCPPYLSDKETCHIWIQELDND